MPDSLTLYKFHHFRANYYLREEQKATLVYSVTIIKSKILENGAIRYCISMQISRIKLLNQYNVIVIFWRKTQLLDSVDIQEDVEN